MIDERTGTVYDYARKAGDVVVSFVWLPKGAPEHLRDRVALWNAVEAKDKRVNSRTARTYEMALPHELTAAQQIDMLKDYVRENFTRKGMAVDASIHRAHAYGDQRNDHAHLVVPTRYVDKTGLAEKNRESDSRESLQAIRDSWERLVNRHLERHGHDARISMKTLEAQGIDRMPQIHMGQGSCALERKGIETDRGDQLRSIANDNKARTVGKEVVSEVADGEVEFIDRDQQEAAWQDSVSDAGIAHAEARRRQYLQSQATEREAFDRRGEDMAARHAVAWGELLERHSADAATGYQPGTFAEAEQATTQTASFFLSLLVSWAEGLTGGAKRPARSVSPDKAKQRAAERRDQERKEQHQRELEAVLQEQAREREQFERRRAEMLHQQTSGLSYYDQQAADKSTLQQAFEAPRDYGDSFRNELVRRAEAREASQGQEREGPQLGG